MTAESVAKDRGHVAPTQAERLIELASMAQLFHAPDGTAYADIYIGSHRETWAIRSDGFSGFLKRRYYGETRGAPSPDALESALDAIFSYGLGRSKFYQEVAADRIRLCKCGRRTLVATDEMEAWAAGLPIASRKSEAA